MCNKNLFTELNYIERFPRYDLAKTIRTRRFRPFVWDLLQKKWCQEEWARPKAGLFITLNAI